MASGILRHFVKNQTMVRNGFMCSSRLYTNETNKDSSAGSENKPEEGNYQAEEYYQYNLYSFNDVNRDMDKYRLPRPSCYSDKDQA